MKKCYDKSGGGQVRGVGPPVDTMGGEDTMLT